ncbi:MAG: hypothetical protein KA035_00035 [Candidatus Levybacteria bacterium]|nr:hypothetical protein [Candidatus Levybacteria bacterium]
MRYLRKVRHFALVGTILGGSLISFGCSGTNVEDNDTGDDSNVTNTQPTTAPVIQKLNDGDNPTPMATPGNSTPECKPGEGDSWKQIQAGEFVPQGTCALVEVTNNDAKSLLIVAGATPIDLTAGSWPTDSNVHINVWTYQNLAAAKAALPGEKRERENQGWSVTEVTTFDEIVKILGGTTDGKQATTPAPAATATPKPAMPTATPLTVPPSKQGARLTGTCGDIPHSDQVYETYGGDTLKAGTLVILRYVSHTDLNIWIEIGCLKNDTYFDDDGQFALHAWYGFSVVPTAFRDGCNEARARWNETHQSPPTWSYGYTVMFAGKADDSDFVKHKDAPPSCRPS